jgi:WD40 repeat protein
VEYASRLPEGEFEGGSFIRDAGGRRWLLAPRWPTDLDVIDLDAEEILPFQLRANPVVELSHDGRWVLSANGAEVFDALHVYDAETGELVLDTPADIGPVVSGSFAPDSSRFTIVSEEGTVQHFSTDDWSRNIDDRTDIRFLTYSPYQHVAATSDADGAILLRDAETLDPISPPMIGHQSQIGDLGRGFFFGEDGRFLVSAATDGARLWDLTTWTEIGDGFPSPNLVAAGGADGGPSLFTSVGDEVLIWNLDVEAWPEIACQAAGRNLTRDEWDRFGPPADPYQATCPQWPAGS